MNKLNRKSRVAALSILSNTTLIILKLLAGIISGSVSIISEAIHSSMDLLAAIIAFISVRVSSKPADRFHPYGHGKVENVSGVVEGLLIFVAAGIIIVEAINKLMHPTEIKEAYLALGVMLISAIVNTFVSRKLFKVSREEDSIALEADALHLKTDVYTSLGVCLGLVLIAISGLKILDPIVAILVALLIIKESWVLCKNAFGPLLDTKLSDIEEENIKNILGKYNDKIVDFHELRTRKSGNIKYIDFHLHVDKSLSIQEAHDLSEIMEKDLEEALKNTNVNIHMEPFCHKEED